MRSNPQPLQQAATPWNTRELSYGAKLGLIVLCAFLLVILLVTLFVFIGVSGALVRGETLPDTLTANLIALAVDTLLFIASLVGLIVLWPRARASTRFVPSYGTIDPMARQAPFEVKFRRYLWGRSMRGTGTVVFGDEALTIQGDLEPHALFQIGIVVLVTVAPLVVLGIGLGIIPALILAYYLGRKKITTVIPYHNLHDLQVVGRDVTFLNSGPTKQVSFTVAANDGERLYRELLSRFPAALGGWTGSISAGA